MGPKSRGKNGTTNSTNESSDPTASDVEDAVAVLDIAPKRKKETPILEYWAKCNFELWQKRITDELGEKFGNYAIFTDGESEWKPEKPQPPSVARDESDPDSIVQWNVYEKASFNLNDEVKEYTGTKAKMFSVIKSYLSEESESQLARNAKYSNALRKRDPILLWQLIEITHSAPHTGVLPLDLAIAYEDYEKLKQHFKESIGQYMPRFRAVTNRLHILEHPAAPLHDKTIAEKFKRSLHPDKFAQFILHDDLSMADSVPQAESVEEVAERAQRFNDIHRAVASIWEPLCQFDQAEQDHHAKVYQNCSTIGLYHYIT